MKKVTSTMNIDVKEILLKSCINFKTGFFFLFSCQCCKTPVFIIVKLIRNLFVWYCLFDTNSNIKEEI